ncbi:DHA2 family efflux MFS transporter permease subunit [Baekduia soli]|uniref:DHA2 family efflux MFS transporter permease subunit n=1 Tax=Baekduia soli TaxID=496014 RepID=A0A5B8U344_9ACTN|nr:DHA2 family efflux MFS transporter permease subunit [Baekduia soli]QEC47446.1 DHA2 family efflux MFS transporter permease subunit [Baekduia soli]
MTPSPESARPRAGWTFAIVSVALFMVTLDNLVVTTALPTIRTDLGASIKSLEWTVNAYTLAYAVLLLTGAALGDRFGRRRMFSLGVLLFTVSSAAAALAPTTGALVAARAAQGLGAAIVTPLTLTLLSGAVPAAKRGLALGAWSGISGLGVALGPVVGGAVVDGISWHWIFWLNVPTGLVLVPLAARYLGESHGPASRLDLPGIGLAGTGLLGIVYGIVRGEALGWTSTTIVASIGAGVVLLAAFVAWEGRAKAPMLPLRFFRSRAFSATNGTSLAMFFGVFGSIFLLSQFFQTTQGLSPLQSGLRVLPWTIMPMVVAPVAGLLSDRIGARPLMAGGLALQAIAIGWLAAVTTPTVAYSALLVPFVLAGTGMALVFAPAANAVLGAVRPEEAGQASGATNAIRELGGVLGVAVLASVFTHDGGYTSPQAYVDGMTAALPIGAAVLALGALLALLIPGRPRTGAATAEADPAMVAVAPSPTGAA